MTEIRMPTATYRVQFRAGMDFARTVAIVPYLAELGVSHLYASPILQAQRGSTHGYDVTDHRQFDEDLGGLDGFLELSAALKGAGLGLILDIVPNHMAASVQNPWWADVLRHGRDSRYAGHFDIDWEAPSLVVPVLGKPYGDALEAGELTLGRDADGYVLRYFEHFFPLSPATVPIIAEAAGTDRATPPDDAALERIGQDRELIHRIHEAQPYRLAYWRLARDGLTNRRFFEISDLVGVCVEEPNVFDDVHRFLFEMVEAGHVDGVRVDHVDGLADPSGYLDRLAHELPRPVPIWVEKILARGERLPEDWPVAGTTGYEFADLVASLVTEPRGVPTLSEGYDAFTGAEHDYGAMRVEAKREIVRQNLAAELDLLTGLAEAALADDPSGRDWGRDSVRQALIGILVALPVYRTYLGDGPPSPADRAILDRVRDEAPAHANLDETGAIDSVLNHLIDAASETDRRLRTRLQQTSGALMAKAVEDTLFYRYNRLISANEVGGEPDHPSQPPAAFHGYMDRHGGTSLNATATHDTKRGEDARMRVAAIAELPDAWLGAVAAFDRELVQGESPVDAEARWLFYQALLGGWQQPADDSLRDRAKTYMQKAVREAKRQTSWLGPNEEYEAGLMAFVDAAFASQRFLGIFDDLTAAFVETGRRKSMAQLALKLLAPGIPDIYQGTEAFDLSFVDPDNRRPVDFEGLRQPPDRDDAPHGTRLKASLMRFGLALRREMPELFRADTYRPLDLPEEERLLAFSRESETAALFVIADLSGRRREAELPDAVPAGRPRSSFPAGVAERDGIAAALAETSVFVGLY